MDLSLILIIVGIFIIIASFFVGNQSKELEKDVEELSVSFYQETHQLKRRLKVVEEELLIDSQTTFGKQNKKVSLNSNVKTTINGIHQILISQVLTLHRQGYNIDEISKRSSLTHDQIQNIISSGGNIK